MLERPVIGYLAAATLVIAATALNVLIQGVTAGRVPFLPFFPTLIVVAYFCGLGPGLLALMLSALATATLWMEPIGAPWFVARQSDAVALALYLMAGGATVVISAFARRALKRAGIGERSLEAARARLDAAHSAARMAEWEWDVRTDRIHLSSSAREVFGKTWTQPAEAADLVDLDERRRVDGLVAEGLKRDRYQLTCRIRRADSGELRWIETRGIVHRDSGGRVTQVTGISLDVTERQQALEAAQAAREEVESITATIQAGVYRCDREGRYLWANPEYRNWFAPGGEPLEGRRMRDTIPPQAWEAKRPFIERVLRGEAVQFEQPVISYTGKPRWVHGAYSPTHDTSGAVTGWVAVVSDLTDRHRLDAALRESEQRLRVALDGARIGMWTTDLRTGLTRCTERNADIFGLDPQQEHHPPNAFRSVIDPRDLEAVLQAWQAGAQSGSYDIEYRIRPKVDEPTRWVLTRGRYEYDPDGKPLQIIGITLDVTAHKEAEAALADANRRKDEFLAILAHELRNPLAPIRYASRLFRATTPPDMIEDAGRMVERQLAHMARLLDDLLDVSRISRGALELHREPVDVREIVKSAVESARASAEHATHTMHVILPEHPLMVNGDLTRLNQVLGNLLSNAIRYSDAAGRIEVKADLSGEDVAVSVQDSGIGIPLEMQDRIFDLFTQGERNARGAPGLGIGLALARQLVELHGGRLDVFSAGVGQGSKFTVWLPRVQEVPAVALSDDDSRRSVAVLGASRTPVLIVDDNRDAADSLRAVLELAGYAPEVAYDGQAALKIAEVVRPAIVLLDLGMPGMSGLEVAQKIRALPWASSSRLIAVTGWGHEEQRRRTREIGFEAHLTKPVDPDELLKLLAATVRQSVAHCRISQTLSGTVSRGSICDKSMIIRPFRTSASVRSVRL